MSIKAVRGFKDILPEEAPLWRRIEAAAARVTDLYGFRELRVPVVERTELFARSIGADTDIVEKEMFSFPDRNGESLTLRPEATAGMVRSLIEHSLAGDGRPLKLYIIGPMFRYERPQKGRMRQFHQFNVEVYNAPDPLVDAEIITLLIQFLNEIGLEQVEIHINSLGCPQCRPVYKEKLQAFLKDRLDRLCPDCQRRFHTNPLRILDCKVESCKAEVKDAPRTVETLCQVCDNHYHWVKTYLGDQKFIEDTTLVRGLDYYTRTVFEAQTSDLGAQNALGGGGRYDNLVKTLGGPDIPAIGFALGLERLVMLLSEKEQPASSGPDLFLVPLDVQAQAKAFNLAQKLRAKGGRVEMEYALASMKSQLRRAGKLGAKKVLILGPDELARGAGSLKNMETGDQSDLPLDIEPEEILKRLKEGDAV